jgi:hypothetical protein
MTKQEKITKAYIESVLEEGHKPASVFAFTKKLKMKETEFYDEFASFTMLESKIWESFFNETIEKMEAEEVYANYSAREKMLAFYYTWIETLKVNRSYVLKFFEADTKNMLKEIGGLTSFKIAFKDFAGRIIIEGIENREVEQRPFISERYADLLYGQAIIVTRFWVKDESKGFEKTDTFIEKSVNTTFDLLGKSPLDSVFDLAKFMFQNR